MGKQRIQELIARHFHGDLDETGSHELAAWLRAEAWAREEFLQSGEIHGRLLWEYGKLQDVRRETERAKRVFMRSVLALAVRWVLDQGPTIALWGARSPDQLRAVREIEGWHIDDETKLEIDSILERCIPVPVSPEFMAPPTKPQATGKGHSIRMHQEETRL